MSKKEFRKKKDSLDKRICYAIGLIIVGFSVWFLAGTSGLLIYFGQSAIAIFELEAVNYIEHYGLSRDWENGKRQLLDVSHSWNSRHSLSSRILLNIPRHSDHHLHPARTFVQLQHYDASPQYPLGYPGMILVALIPSVWQKIVHPILDNVSSMTRI